MDYFIEIKMLDHHDNNWHRMKRQLKGKVVDLRFKFPYSAIGYAEKQVSPMTNARVVDSTGAIHAHLGYAPAQVVDLLNPPVWVQEIMHIAKTYQKHGSDQREAWVIFHHCRDILGPYFVLLLDMPEHEKV